MRIKKNYYKIIITTYILKPLRTKLITYRKGFSVFNQDSVND